MITPKKISEDEWLAQYKPLVNPVDAGCGFDFGDGCTLVETYGDHLAYLKTIPDDRIWTAVESDDEEDERPVIVSGMHFVNRLGYFVTENPWNEEIEVKLDI